MKDVMWERRGGAIADLWSQISSAMEVRIKSNVHRSFVIVMVALVFCVPGLSADNRPNIILIVADDMGYGDAGCYGDSNLVPTPNVDRLAREGVRFTQGYVTCSVCGPSRYGLFTGMYQQRLGVQWNPDTWNDLKNGKDETLSDNRIPKGQLLINQALGQGGYVTGMSGKSNMPCYPKTTFDEYKWIMAFGGDYFPDERGHYSGVDEPKTSGGHKRIIWGPEREGDVYLTDQLGDHAVEFIERHKDETFFYYLGFNAPHSPMQAKTSHRLQVAHLKTEATRMYGAMLISMDENIGKVLDTLDRLGLAENTVVAFLSDNGATFAYNVLWPADWPRELLGSNGPLRDHKGTNYEGGIRVPYIIRWPAELKKAMVFDKPVSALDLYPTLCAAADVDVPTTAQLDGVNLLPFLRGTKSGKPHDTLYWHNDGTGAVRHHDFKLVVGNDRYWLYNLASDVGEQTDLAREKPRIVKELLSKYGTFSASLPPTLNAKARKK